MGELSQNPTPRIPIPLLLGFPSPCSWSGRDGVAKVFIPLWHHSVASKEEHVGPSWTCPALQENWKGGKMKPGASKSLFCPKGGINQLGSRALQGCLSLVRFRV